MPARFTSTQRVASTWQRVCWNEGDIPSKAWHIAVAGRSTLFTSDGCVNREHYTSTRAASRGTEKSEAQLHHDENWHCKEDHLFGAEEGLKEQELHT